MSDRRWYCLGKDGVATLCADKDDAEQSAKLASLDWPRNAPYRAVQLVEADELDALQADADRYRWLRNFHAAGISDNLPHIAAGGDYIGAWTLHSEEADKAIDAARARLNEGDI